MATRLLGLERLAGESRRRYSRAANITRFACTGQRGRRHRHSDGKAAPAAPVGKSANPAGAWFWTNKRTCVFVRVGWANTKPASAAPVHINGYPGLYRTLKNGVRAIYAPVAPGTDNVHPRGGWVVLTVSAKAPQEKVVRLIIVPAG